MVDFRRCITALAMLALFAGLAMAQVTNGNNQLTCSTNVTNTPQLRGEGFTEMTGDITLTCTGGTALAAGSTIPLVNITIFYGSAVTSRLFSTAPNVSEALLLIDEPGSGLAGFGANLPQILCTTPLTGCQAQAGFQTGSSAVVPGTNSPAPNVYQGVTNGNTVTFFGVPVLPPTTTGSRVYRITNVRVNATPLNGGNASGGTPETAFISVSNAASLSITQSSVNVGFVSPGLDTTNTKVVNSTVNFNQCSTATRLSANLIQFRENFGTAFKTRIVAQSNTLFAGQGNAPGFTDLTQGSVVTPNQNTPGGIYPSESNFVFNVTGSGGTASGTNLAGLADYGTRLKATFNNVPANATLFVSVTNVNNATLAVTPPSPIGGSAGNTGSTGFALLVQSETVSDGTSQTSGFFPQVFATDNANGAQTNFLVNSTVNTGIVAIPTPGGTGTAVWEVVNTNPNTNENFLFGVFLSFTAATATNSPAPGIATVNLSYAPTATSPGAASTTVTIPRFQPDLGTARNDFNINICRTVLLFPFVTNQQGFDTGITVANTSNDSPVFSTGAQSGACTFNFYGGTTLAPTTPPAAFTTPKPIVAGTVFADALSNPLIAPGFQGYIIAVCSFQYAHGFAFINNPSQINNVAMGYLALVIPDVGTGTRVAGPDCSGVTGCPTNGESAAH